MKFYRMAFSVFILPENKA